MALRSWKLMVHLINGGAEINISKINANLN